MRRTLTMAILVAVGGAAALAARGQATQRPGEPTQAQVFVQNRSASDAIPVVVHSIAGVSYVRVAGIESNVVVPTKAAPQGWEYRMVPLQANANGGALAGVGNEGWEAVGILQSNPTGATILFKRPR